MYIWPSPFAVPLKLSQHSNWLYSNIKVYKFFKKLKMYDCKKFLKCITAFSQFNPWVRKIAWRREWLPTPVSLPREFHGQRSLAGYRPQGQKESDATERLTQPLILTKKLTKASPDPLLTLLVWESWKLTPQALVSFPLPPPTASSLLPLTLQGEDKSGVLT